eukprot:1471794-Alexandrium_andersonii.AAC.1
MPACPFSNSPGQTTPAVTWRKALWFRCEDHQRLEIQGGCQEIIPSMRCTAWRRVCAQPLQAAASSAAQRSVGFHHCFGTTLAAIQPPGP